MELVQYEYGGCSAHHSIDLHPAESDFPLHAHPYCEVFYFIKGKGYYTVEGRDYPLSPHAVLLMRDGEIHKLHIESPRPALRALPHGKANGTARRPQAQGGEGCAARDH